VTVRPVIPFIAALALAATAAEPAVKPAEPGAGNAPATPARVVVTQDSAATSAFLADDAVVKRIFDRGLLAFTGQTNQVDAWRTLVRTQDVIGIKVCAAPGPVSGTRPAVVAAMIESLLAAGHPARGIVIWDKQPTPLKVAGWVALAERYGVRVAASVDRGWDAERYYEASLIGRLVYGDFEFDSKAEGAGRKSFLSKLLTQDITRIISVAPLLNHNLAGVNGHLVGVALGAVDNTLRFESHPDRLAEAVPEIYSLPEILERVVLCVSDALVCQFRGEEGPQLHYAVALNELRFSKDPVALDVVAMADVNRLREAGKYEGEKPIKTDLYTNAAVIDLGIADPKEIDVKRVP
jgi:hypothetical protein